MSSLSKETMDLIAARGDGFTEDDNPPVGYVSLRVKAHEIWSDVYRQLGELARQSGCEAGARRAYHDGRFAALKELGLLGQDNAPRVRPTLTTMTEPESTEATEASADEAEATSDDDATEADEASAE